jgi:hypothetical protein
MVVWFVAKMTRQHTKLGAQGAKSKRRTCCDYLFSLASSLIALPPFSISFPAPSMVLQPESDATVPAMNTDANNMMKIFLIMMRLLNVRNKLKNGMYRATSIINIEPFHDA